MTRIKRDKRMMSRYRRAKGEGNGRRRKNIQ
jgi:hypothetical protein